MSHHGPGPTGMFPQGKLNADDEGELGIAFAADPEKRKVIVDFGKPVSWIGFDPDQARDIAKMLMAKADIADSKKEDKK